MDEEDIADAEDDRRVQTADGFAGIGSTENDATRQGAFIDLINLSVSGGENTGLKLLKKMGWREGQGVGPKVRRGARINDHNNEEERSEETHLFPPENTRMIGFIRKNDHKGLGFDGETRLSVQAPVSDALKSDGEEDDRDRGLMAPKTTKKKKPIRGGIGIGILNDTGSDDEDPYEIGPKISYNRVIGGDKKKKKPVNGVANSLLKSKPVFISQKTALAKASVSFRKCHDGRLPLNGFVLSSNNEFSSVTESSGNYPPPKIPEGWVSSKQPKAGSQQSAYLSTTDAAKASHLDPKSRASILGEASLPGKSVFDFLTPAARARLASASGKTNLPAALGEIPEGYIKTEAERDADLLSQIPKVDKYTADAALSRGASGFMPYGEDEGKRSRYRAYLEHQSGILPNPLQRAPGVSRDDWLKELREFANCAQIFKPMSGMMATRFTSSSTAPQMASDAPDSTTAPLLSKPAPKIEDPAEQAAKMGMYGPLTRTTADWYPTRLLCKRFNVKPPAHVQPGSTEHGEEGGEPRKAAPDLVSKTKIDDMMRQAYDYAPGARAPENLVAAEVGAEIKLEVVVVDAERNEALEGKRAGEAVFKAIFGDDSDDDD